MNEKIKKAKTRKIIDVHNEDMVNQLYRNGYNYSEIAKVLGCTRQTVFYYFNPDKKKNFPPKKPSAEAIQRQREKEKKLREAKRVIKEELKFNERLQKYKTNLNIRLMKSTERKVTYFETGIAKIEAIEGKWIDKEEVLTILRTLLVELKKGNNDIS